MDVGVRREGPWLKTACFMPGRPASASLGGSIYFGGYANLWVEYMVVLPGWDG